MAWRLMVACLACSFVGSFCRQYWDWTSGQSSGPYYLLDHMTSLTLTRFARYESSLYMSLLGLSLSFVVYFFRTRRKAVVAAIFIAGFVFVAVDLPPVFIDVGRALGEQTMAAILKICIGSLMVWIVLPMILSFGYIVLFYDSIRARTPWVFVRNIGLFSTSYLALTLILRFFLFRWDFSQDGSWESYFALAIAVFVVIFVFGITGQIVSRGKAATVRENGERSEE